MHYQSSDWIMFERLVTDERGHSALKALGRSLHEANTLTWNIVLSVPVNQQKYLHLIVKIVSHECFRHNIQLVTSKLLRGPYAIHRC